MEIKAGMKLRGNINGREILILNVADQYVQYRDLKYGMVLTIGRKTFEHCFTVI